ncbi:MAG: glycolate oxidase subunit GlcF [Proteobacteria bacterium]|jgi:glycolate oxidase iron-sulfur subunit|nr:glycolate oxidase subunit GlcF [Pseudomonadota bacterium]MBT6193636.1 glycolate oxidase subunit GlcF [Pseudomonadota bacterium]MBT6464367.1 glycolate oxidase subunit GlcF [Pseudomonadota bacterium]MBT6673949.1 glycolate oxidase subunit GlcF [Pseudomonadota bacterium]MBT7246047.1 glycolate oxidase subunit GlcF [Pseudomonadota bacterium]
MRAGLAESNSSKSFALAATEIIRSCVHCGMCNASCPTYQLTGDELEGPRGRIYLIKGILETGETSDVAQTHLDQCLVCRSCEASCPSGVKYGELLELTKPHIESSNPSPLGLRIKRYLIVQIVPSKVLFSIFFAVGRILKPLLSSNLKTLIPERVSLRVLSRVHHKRKALLLSTCAQSVVRPSIDTAAIRIFDRLGITLIPVAGAGCCGALALHCGYEDKAIVQAKANIDAWWPYIELGAESIIATSSGCGLQLKGYERLLKEFPDYSAKSKHLAGLIRDPIELIDDQKLSAVIKDSDRCSVVFQSPCSLQHGLKINGRVEAVLERLGWNLTKVKDPHLCCGSAGSYSILYPETSAALREEKLNALCQGSPELIVTANIGCQLHLAAKSAVPVIHWLELIERELN